MPPHIHTTTKFIGKLIVSDGIWAASKARLDLFYLPGVLVLFLNLTLKNIFSMDAKALLLNI